MEKSLPHSLSSEVRSTLYHVFMVYCAENLLIHTVLTCMEYVCTTYGSTNYRNTILPKATIFIFSISVEVPKYFIQDFFNPVVCLLLVHCTHAYELSQVDCLTSIALSFSFLIRARLDCLTKPCDIIHMIVFSPKYQSDGFISCLHCLSDVFVIMGN